MEKLLMLLFVCATTTCAAQVQHETTTKVGKFSNVTLERHITAKNDTLYDLSFDNLQYPSITDMVLFSFNRDGIKQLMKNIDDLAKEENQPGESYVSIAANYGREFRLYKKKNMGVVSFTLMDEKGRYTYITQKKALEMSDAIYEQIHRPKPQPVAEK